jgi:hypothetical protein
MYPKQQGDKWGRTVINSGVRRHKIVSVACHKMRWIVIYLPMFLSQLLVSDRYICIFRVTDAKSQGQQDDTPATIEYQHHWDVSRGIKI